MEGLLRDWTRMQKTWFPEPLTAAGDFSTIPILFSADGSGMDGSGMVSWPALDAQNQPVEHAKVAELVDAQDSGSCVRKDVGVRVPPFAPPPPPGPQASESG